MITFLLLCGALAWITSGVLALTAQTAVVLAPRVRLQHFTDALHAAATRRMRVAVAFAEGAALLAVLALAVGVVA